MILFVLSNKIQQEKVRFDPGLFGLKARGIYHCDTRIVVFIIIINYNCGLM